MVAKSIHQYNEWYRKIEPNAKIGFVPTMGALHDGHLSLIKRSVSENRYTVVSIFVNPTQFNNPKDLANYPVTIEKDLSALKDKGVDVIFIPTVTEMYPHGTDHLLTLDLEHLDKIMEGYFRPGHFTGVVTIVSILFNNLKPARTYFGEKDYQQYMVIKKLCKLKFPSIEVIPCETVREHDGLAYSSRNLLLSIEARKKAKLIYNTLQNAADLIKKLSSSELKNWVKNTINSVDGFSLEYFETFDEENLLPVSEQTKNARFFIAVNIEGIRLIDNYKIAL